ncbi:c-type cytochrome [Verminephrobacter eiseniae]|uniref:c-type cytochrome n=1 Tax=Verminephrobacter eiseniae TaxID=364317 RepID=UPI0022387451|nr:cytochrome c family protein [Verminephrobacter eiseniae]MCW5236351.1 cytochrome c family protein [Verminephrobacter eiseniae]
MKMEHVRRAVLVAAVIAPGLPAAAQDVNAGRQVFAQCVACHAVTTANGVGPGLLGIVGSKSASVPGFRYGAAIKRAHLIWDEKNLDAYIADPQKALPGTLMPFSGIADAQQRADLIAYLKTIKSP